MIHLKTPKERAIMKEGGMHLKCIIDTLVDHIHPGITPREIDAIADRLLYKTGGEPSFKKVPGYNWATCINVNDMVVHGIPTDDPIVAGDIVGIDVGLYYHGFHTDTSWTVFVHSKDQTTKRSKNYQKIQHFLQAGEQALKMGIGQVKAGNRIGHISQAMQKVIEDAGYAVVAELVGHGIGHQLHEDPEVPGKVLKPIAKTAIMKEGLALAIEIIYTCCSPVIYVDDDDWTIRTDDGKISGLFEKTVIVENHGVCLLT